MRRLLAPLLANLVLLAAQPAAAVSEALYIDVRSAAEYATGHIEGAPNVPYDVIGQRIADLASDPGVEIRLYCQSGGRAGIARRTLEAMGYTNVHNDGGYEDLRRRLGL